MHNLLFTLIYSVQQTSRLSC